MTTVVFEKTPEGRYLSFTCMGHAGTAARGKDLLCCAISTLVTHTINGLSELACEEIKVTENEETGFIRCELLSEIGEASVLLLDALKLSLEELSGQYGTKYLQVRQEVV